MSVERLLVVVPAHDEEQTLGRCLHHLAAAAARVADRVEVRTVVVLDDCTDRSAAVAGHHRVGTVACRARNVGVARALGVAEAARDVTDDARTWVATTDADSRVGRGWLAEHLAAADAGHDAWLGRVSPDPADLLPDVAGEWHRRHRSRGHVHGANLGVRLSAYRACGGFPPLAVGEDVALVEALLAQSRSLASGGNPVVTSGRLSGRTPAGFAGYLAALADEVTPAPAP